MTLDTYISEKDKLQQVIGMTRPRKTHDQLPALPPDKSNWPSLKIGLAVGGVSVIVVVIVAFLVLRGKK